MEIVITTAHEEKQLKYNLLQIDMIFAFHWRTKYSLMPEIYGRSIQSSFPMPYIINMSY